MDLHAMLPREHLQSSVSSVNLVLLKFVQGPTYVEKSKKKGKNLDVFLYI